MKKIIIFLEKEKSYVEKNIYDWVCGGTSFNPITSEATEEMFVRSLELPSE